MQGVVFRLADGFGFGRNRVWDAGKGLRSGTGAAEDLWPAGARGRAAPNLPSVKQLANMIVALATVQADDLAIIADRTRAFNVLRLDGAGISFETALTSLIEQASTNPSFLAQITTHQGPIVQLAPIHRAAAEIAIGPNAGRYSAADNDIIAISSLMHVRSFGITSIALLNASVFHTLAAICADIEAANASSKDKSGTLPGVPLFSNQDRDAIPEAYTLDSTQEKETSQASSRAPGRQLNRTRRLSDGKTRHTAPPLPS